MLKGISCYHAIAALYFRKLEPIHYVAHWYTKDTYLKTYNSFIQPVTNMAMWPKSTNPPVLPPEIKKLPGRLRKCRRKEQTENKTGKLSKRDVEMTCSLCHAKSHNKKGCPMNPQSVRGRGRARGRGTSTSSTRSSVGSSTVPSNSQPGRGRGRPRGSVKQPGMANQSATMPMNSAVVTGSLGHHKPRPGGLKWKRSPAITQQGLQQMSGQKRMKTRAKAAELNSLSQTSSSTAQK
ncbi:uncharacterized protein LOC132603269 isoform X5 [Lycium barbarum]|uniref:uncharacterized protein LOC132603269 isoform X5 n=1 Tax=Lycium barbarum TaxID=112863 RepID=UPI00293EDA63|nr:uncharacterized protein LOC132603269 isoform X5 [Lycium barbarum]